MHPQALLFLGSWQQSSVDIIIPSVPMAFPVVLNVYMYLWIVDETIGGLEGRNSVCLAHAIVAVASPASATSLLDDWHCTYPC